MKSPRVLAVSCAAWLPLAYIAGCDQIGLGPPAVTPATSASPSDHAARLIGVWIASDAAEPVSGEIGQRMRQGFDQNALKIEFQDAGRLTIHRNSARTPPGTWQVTRADGRQILVRLCAPGLSADDAPADFVITLADDNHLTLRPADSGADGLAFTLTRQSPRVASR
jgi:hypothetical protein